MGARGRKSAADKQAEEFIQAQRKPVKKRSVKNGAPAHLRADGAAFFRAMLADHDISDASALATLAAAAECLDRHAAARAAMAKTGPIISNQYDIEKAHPALAVAKDALNGFLACMRLLGLDMKVKTGGVDQDGAPWLR